MEHELSQTHCTQIVPIYSMQYYSIQYIQYIWLFAHIDKNEYKQFKTCCTHSTKRNMNILKLIAHRLLQYIAMLYILYNIYSIQYIRCTLWQKGTWTIYNSLTCLTCCTHSTKRNMNILNSLKLINTFDKKEHEHSETRFTQIVAIYCMQYIAMLYILCIIFYAFNSLHTLTKRNMNNLKLVDTFDKRNMNILKLVAHRLLPYIVCNILYAIYSMQYIVCNILYAIYCYAIYSMQYILCILFIAHFDLYILTFVETRWRHWQKGTWTTLKTLSHIELISQLKKPAMQYILCFLFIAHTDEKEHEQF
jgi:hypothetical protein